jgi:hypothetical protein
MLGLALRFAIDILKVQKVTLGVPKKNNPNLISVGEGFGLFLLLGGQYE